MKNLYFFTAFFLFSFLSVRCYKTTIHHESEQFGIDQIIVFDDETVLLSLLKPMNDTCVKPELNFRTLYPNGTVNGFKVDFQIPEYNFCYRKPYDNYPFYIAQCRPESLYVLYIDDSANYNVLIITRTGTIISNTHIAPANIINGTTFADGQIKVQGSAEYGFLFSRYETDLTAITWSYFDKPDNEGKFKPLNNGTFPLNAPFDEYYVFSGIDGKFYFLTYISSHSTFDVYLNFIKPSITNEIVYSFVIYTSTIPNLHTRYGIYVVCEVNKYVRTMNYCSFNFQNLSNQNMSSNVIIEFEDLGKITSRRNLNLRDVLSVGKFDSKDIVNINFGTTDLYYGGYLTYSCVGIGTMENNYQILNATILNDNKNHHSNLDFPLYFQASHTCAIVTGHATAFLITQNDKISWRILSTDLPEFFTDGGYGNPRIKSTYPPINSTIPFLTESINITYYFPIKSSYNNISIYQYNNNGEPLLRQSVPGKLPTFFSYSSDSKTVNIKVLKSTFNKANSNYYITVDDDAVRMVSNQSLLGIEKDRWSFNTGNHEYSFFDEITGIFFLTDDGVKYFKSLSSDEQTRFLSLLKSQLAEIIPINADRLNDIKHHTYYADNDDEITLSLSIKLTMDLNEPDVESIANYLDILIRNKKITPISKYNATIFIEEKFGFTRDVRPLTAFYNYVYPLVGAVVGFVILIAFYFYARRRYREGQNAIIFDIVSIVLDVVFDALFVLHNAKILPYLYIPSIIFFIVPIAVNLLMSMIIILLEIIKNHLFNAWFKNNAIVAILFTILAAADLKVLNILSSQFAGIMLLNADISENAQRWIFYGTIVGLIIEDIPQMTVQIIYIININSYNVIPLVTLVVSGLILLAKMVRNLRKFFSMVFNQLKEKRNSRTVM